MHSPDEERSAAGSLQAASYWSSSSAFGSKKGQPGPPRPLPLVHCRRRRTGRPHRHFSPLIFGGDSGSNESAGPTAPATPPPESAGPTAPATPPPQMSAQALLAEREANATRFDDTFKGKWVTVSGQIEKIDGGKVYLRGDGFLSDVVLEDLSADKQIPLNVGEEFSATCKVGNYILGTIFLNSCFGGDSGSNESAGPTAPTPIDLATTRFDDTFKGKWVTVSARSPNVYRDSR